MIAYPLITFSKQKIEPDSTELLVCFLVHTVPQEENAKRARIENGKAKLLEQKKRDLYFLPELLPLFLVSRGFSPRIFVWHVFLLTY